MGIQGFTKFVKTKAPTAIKEVEYAHLPSGPKAVDASGYFYQFCHDPKSNKKPHSHIDGFYQLFMKLLRHNILPVMVLDGKAPPEKSSTLKKRAQKKAQTVNGIKQLQEDLMSLIDQSIVGTEDDPIKVEVGEIQTQKPMVKVELDQLMAMYKGHPLEKQMLSKIEEIREASKHLIHFQSSCYDDIYQLCDLMKIPIFRAKGEADALCAKLSLTGQVNGVISEDSDNLLYGCRQLIRKVGWGMEAEVIDLDVLLAELKITHDQFIDLCILTGTDYTTDKIGGCGAVRAYELVAQGLTIEDIITNIQKFKEKGLPSLKSFKKYDLPTDLADFEFEAARQLIKTAPLAEPDVVFDPIWDPSCIQVAQLAQFMTQKCNYQSTTVVKHHQQLIANQTLAVVVPKYVGPKVKLQMKSSIANVYNCTLPIEF
jgi:flap endonuclease-1